MTPQTQTATYIVLFTVLSSSSAEPVYTWIDAGGVTNFSDTPPADEGITTGEIEALPPPAAGRMVEDDYYSVIRQVERMQAQRLQNEQMTAERLRAEAEASRARAEAQAVQQAGLSDTSESVGYFYPYYPNYRHRYPGRYPDRPPTSHKREHHNRGFIREMPLPEGVRLPSNIRGHSVRESHRMQRD